MTKILYIAGAGRSGSTLLDVLLGQIPGVTSTGELRHIWQRGWIENQLCGCGTPFRECLFWRKVAGEAYGGFDGVDAERMLLQQRYLERLRRLPLALELRRAAQYSSVREEYGAVLHRLYQAVQQVSGASAVVDSSKAPEYAAVLKRILGLEVLVVHLVRDSRAVAFSWQRKRLRPEVHWTQAYMDNFSPARCARAWLERNTITELLRLLGGPQRRVCYEELMARPEESLAEIAAFAGIRWTGNADPRTALSVNHTVSGNPMRLHRGALPLRIDDEWRRALSSRDWRIVTAFTLPMLLRYGYAVGGPAGQG